MFLSLMLYFFFLNFVTLPINSPHCGLSHWFHILFRHMTIFNNLKSKVTCYPSSSEIFLKATLMKMKFSLCSWMFTPKDTAALFVWSISTWRYISITTWCAHMLREKFSRGYILLIGFRKFTMLKMVKGLVKTLFRRLTSHLYCSEMYILCTVK